MLRHWPIFFVATCFCALTAACDVPVAPVRQGVLDLRGQTIDSRPMIHLDGQWEFFWQTFFYNSDASADVSAPRDQPRAKNLSGASPAEPEPEPRARITRVSPDYITVPNNWSQHVRDGDPLPRFGHASYRLKIFLDEPRDGMAIHLQDAASSIRLFVNGRLLLQQGLPHEQSAEYEPAFGPRFTDSFRLERENEIVVEVANFALHQGGLRRTVRLGSREAFVSQRKTREWFVILLLGAFLFMALYHLFLFSLEARERSALFFAVMCICMGLRISMTTERFFLDLFPGLDYEVYLRTLLIATYTILPACILFLYYLFPGLVHAWFVRTICLIMAVLLLIALVTPAAESFYYTVPLFGVLIFVGSVYGPIILVKGVRQSRPGAGLLLFAFVWFIGIGVNDWLHASQIINTRFYTEYGFIVFVFAQAFSVSKRILTTRRLSETLAADLEESNTRLRSLDRLKDEFLAMTSHELRTPLQGIIGIAGSLRDRKSDANPDDLDQRLELIVSSGRRLADLVTEILDFSALRYGDIQLGTAPINLHVFARLQLTLIEYNLAPEQKLKLNNEVPADLPAVLADEARLTQIFQNLLSNAVHHTPAGSISISARERDGMIEIGVHDTGVGIAPEELERIFQQFEQGSRKNQMASGIGLGLSIARALTELHGGSLRAESSPGAGSSFLFTLPRSDETPAIRSTAFVPAGPPAGLPTLAPVGAAAPPVPRTPDRPDLPLVLMLDDEPVNLQVMQAYLEQTARVIATADAAEARAIIAGQSRPDCLVLDLMMPVSGLDFMRELRAEYSLTELPILIVTAMTRTGDLLRALEGGANDYLTKPFEKEEFLLRVSNLTALSRAHRGSRLAAQEATRQERERINADLHDHLGASLTDLKIMSDQALKDPDLKPEFSRRLQEKVGAVIRILRSDLLGLEDLELLEENFLEGLQLMLLRRYVEAEREFDMQIPPGNPIQIEADHVPLLYAVLKEIATNDLKYGAGQPATLRFRAGTDLEIEFESLSNYRLETHGTGRGTAGMIRRLSSIGGSLQIHIDSGKSTPRSILIKIKIPTPVSPAG